MSDASVGLDKVPQGPLHWEDLVIGTQYQTASRTITEADVVSFAALTGDFNRVHVDAEYAKTSTFGQRIAHGLLVISIGTGLNTRTIANQLMEPSMIGLLEIRLKFLRPTFLGDTIHVDVEVVDRRETKRPDRGVVTFRRTTINQRGEAVAEAMVTILILRRQAHGEPAVRPAGERQEA